jgi:sulfate-transporting ATPase
MAAAFRSKAITPAWLEAKAKAAEARREAEGSRAPTLSRELEWIRMSPKARQAKSKARINAYEKMSQEQIEQKAEELEIQIPPGKHLGDWSSKGSTFTSRTATAC